MEKQGDLIKMLEDVYNGAMKPDETVTEFAKRVVQKKEQPDVTREGISKSFVEWLRVCTPASYQGSLILVTKPVLGKDIEIYRSAEKIIKAIPGIEVL